jgi:hypothetical protein
MLRKNSRSFVSIVIAGGLVGEPCGTQGVKPLQLYSKRSFTLWAGVKGVGKKGRLHSFDRQSGAIDRHNNQPPNGTRCGGASAIVCPRYCLPSLSNNNKQTKRLNKPVLDNPDPNASVSVWSRFISSDRAFDRCRPSLEWSSQEAHHEANG